MAKTVKTRIVKIGNSHGIRIPNLLLKQTGMSGEVELEADNGRLIVRPVSTRQGWERQFEQMASAGDDLLLEVDMPASTQWDAEEWEW